MTPQLTLVRPDDLVSEETGNDGLTDAERAEHALAYHSGVGNKTISEAELKAFAVWRARRERA